MELLAHLLDVALQFNAYLGQLMVDYGPLIYGLIALIIFCEVGLVVAPFLPGDSMLFAIGALCATGVMDLAIVLTLFPLAAIAGDNFNRQMGQTFGHRAFHGRNGRFFNQKNLDRAQHFFQKYGTMAVTFCRFIPFFRTFVPFVAGMAGMCRRRFLAYSVLGGTSWVAVCVLAGYFLGNLEFIKKHFELVVLTVIGVSLFPFLRDHLKNLRNKTRSIPPLNVAPAQPVPVQVHTKLPVVRPEHP